jgi:hypothetical protein
MGVSKSTVNNIWRSRDPQLQTNGTTTLFEALELSQSKVVVVR